jgi:hypothetical protein
VTFSDKYSFSLRHGIDYLCTKFLVLSTDLIFAGRDLGRIIEQVASNKWSITEELNTKETNITTFYKDN